MATYPAAVKSFTSKTDNVDTVYAADVNQTYDEVNAIEATLGINPMYSATSMGGTFNGATSYNWATVKARLDNIENGVIGDAHGSLYVHQHGGDTIQSTSTTVVPLVLQGASSGTADLLQVKNGSGTSVLRVDNSGATILGPLTATTLSATSVSASSLAISTVTATSAVTAPNLPYAWAAGTLTISSTANAVATGTASFPSSRFTLAPVVVAVVNQNTSAAQGSAYAPLQVCNVSTTSFTVQGEWPDSIGGAGGQTRSTNVRWIAVQMTSSSATG